MKNWSLIEISDIFCLGISNEKIIESFVIIPVCLSIPLHTNKFFFYIFNLLSQPVESINFLSISRLAFYTVMSNLIDWTRVKKSLYHFFKGEWRTTKKHWILYLKCSSYHVSHINQSKFSFGESRFSIEKETRNKNYLKMVFVGNTIHSIVVSFKYHLLSILTYTLFTHRKSSTSFVNKIGSILEIESYLRD